MSATEFDYIIVGAGSAGAALATRLGEDPQVRVLLLEAGAARQADFWVQTPAGVAKILTDPRYVWPSRTTPQHGLAGQEIYWPHGKLPGGSSSVNGMIFVRGDPAEYDHWSKLGCTGWDYAALLPYFKRLESTKFGDDRWRGRTGPIRVTPLGDTQRDPLSDAFVAACREAGIPEVDDYNGAQWEGAGYLQLSTRDGRRCSTALGYLAAARSRANLELRVQSHVARVLFEGRVAVGVELVRDGRREIVRASREVIVSAGPIRSPHILELSGIGQAPRLQALGIPVVQDSPAVGENLRDHLQGRITFECSRPITLNDILNSRLRTLAMGARYLLTRRGFMSMAGSAVHAQARTRPEQTRAQVKIQLQFFSGADRYSAAQGAGLDPYSGFAIGFFQLRPESIGHVHAVTTDPLADPVIDPNYFSHQADIEAMLDALRLSRRLVEQPALRHLATRETRPGIDVRDDAGLLDYIKTSGQTSWHPIGTCRMGADAAAVVDPQLRVRGVERLRVVDSSIMPTMPSSNTNAASIMIGEKAADLIRSRTPR